MTSPNTIIADLQAELAAAQADAAHWKNNHETEVRRARILKERTDMPIERVQAYEKWGEDQQKLATSQAREQQLLEALKVAGKNCVDDFIAAGALQLADKPQDDTALRSIVAKAGEVMRENTLRHCWYDNTPKQIADEIRALPAISLEDLK